MRRRKRGSYSRKRMFGFRIAGRGRTGLTDSRQFKRRR